MKSNKFNIRNATEDERIVNKAVTNRSYKSAVNNVWIPALNHKHYLDIVDAIYVYMWGNK